MNAFQKLSDEKLFKLCGMFGANALLWRQKFAGLLPEVNRRKLYAKKGFGSIFEFAKKLAGMSEDQVRRILNLQERFRDKPNLHSLLINGEVSTNKLAKIASIATTDNDEDLAQKTKILSTRALETLTRDEKIFLQNDDIHSSSSEGLFEPQNEEKAVHVNTKVQSNIITGNSRINILGLNLSTEILSKLLELQRKGVDINELLLEFLNKREKEIEEEKAGIVNEYNEMGKEEWAQANLGTADRNRGSTKKAHLFKPSGKRKLASRYIPARIKKVLKKEYGMKCSIPTCNRESQAIHHTQRFSFSKNHNPYFLAPLCRDHHLIAHSIDVKFREKRAEALIGRSGG